MQGHHARIVQQRRVARILGANARQREIEQAAVEYTSERTSVLMPSKPYCSGGANPIVPYGVETPGDRSARVHAIPKSITWAPSDESTMLAGDRSRWMTP